MPHVHPMLRNLMRTCLEKNNGRVHWGTIKNHVDLDTLPNAVKGACTINLLGVCPAGDRCHIGARHRPRLSDSQAN